MNKEYVSFQASMPAVAAAFTPIFAIFPATTVSVRHSLDGIAEWIFIIVMILFAIAALVTLILVGMKKYLVSVQDTAIQAGKKEYLIDKIERVEYKQRNRYLYIRLKGRMSFVTLYVKDKGDVDRIMSGMQNWSAVTGVTFTIK